jgi:hypothetical protein
MIKPLAVVIAAAATLTLWGPPTASARTAGPDCDAVQRAAQAEIEAACPCDGAAAHTDHVRCVTKKLRELSACTPDASGKRSCGSIPRTCVAKIRRLASRSACGKPAETVTCCVARQRDCAGDSNPGDGKKDGTCTGTKRKCDRVTECMVPKCELAGSAERCTALGGTLGKGRNCSTACDE